MKHEALTQRIIGCVIKVHRTLGPGFVESVYRNALLMELRNTDLSVEAEKEVVVRYEGVEVGQHRLDVLIEGCVLLELKAVADLAPAHYEQLRSYLRATNLDVGLLINFGRERADIRRIDQPPTSQP
jgi:GxxExxY protein